MFFGIGAVFGSFACCQAERMHLREEGKKLGKRSECLFCEHKLEWFELIPIFSWLFLRGRCRKCKKNIGKIELVSEIMMGVIFGLILWFILKQVGVFGGLRTGARFAGVMSLIENFNVNEAMLLKMLINPVVVLRLLILLSSAVLFWILFVYDLKWQSLPAWILYALIGLGLAYFVLNELTSLGFIMQEKFGVGAAEMLKGKLEFAQQLSFLKRDILMLVGGLIILPGLYFVLYRFSKEKLVGSGDYLLTISMVLFLGRFELALTLLCVANLLALFWNTGKILQKKETRIAFGPYLILGFWMIFMLGQEILRYLYVAV